MPTRPWLYGGRPMMSRNRLAAVTGIVLAGLIVAASLFVVRETFLRPRTINAYFTTATAIYPGDDVRVSGIKVGSIAVTEFSFSSVGASLLSLSCTNPESCLDSADVLASS